MFSKREVKVLKWNKVLTFDAEHSKIILKTPLKAGLV